MRCPECGVNNSGNETSYCSTCGYQFVPHSGRSGRPHSSDYERPNINDEYRLINNPVDQRHQQRQENGSIVHQEAHLEGTVVAMDGPYLEPQDFNIAGFLLKLIMVIILAPVIIGIFLLYVAFSIPLSIIGLGRVAGCLNPIKILVSIGLFRGLMGRSRKNEDVPVRLFYVQDEAGDEYALRMKGHLRSGSMAPGHRITARGKWRDGVLHVSEAFNQRTGSKVVVKNDRWKWAFSGMILVIIALLVLLSNSI